ncbi:putative glutathionylspermidine synthase [Pseudomonas phage phiK7A1]|uniref:Putative glutathionylspermidine synthase n=1 Tax=Pseudomonas phage phiK7A1 TaxID=2759194 RepID=A0A7H0XFM0_9CAUD|nr:putative glutathionylspermidine synthase [Pseudomonas phage phiK7A1]
MKVVHKRISFNVNTVIEEELPYMNTFYRSRGQLKEDVMELLEFPIKNQAAMPFYAIKDSTTYRLNQQFEDYYSMMDYALAIAFHDRELLNKFFDCSFLRKWGKQFVPYAEATFHKKHPALYGRYDACFDPVTEELLGVYEFNGDTPVMLFESVNLQARFSAELGTDQYNNWWSEFMERFSSDYKNVAVVHCSDYVDDAATAETIAQAFEAARFDRSVSFLDLRELDFDHMHLSKPWVARGSDTPLDAVYILSPWEEMIETFPAMLSSWERWIDNVHIFEPAWRWFFAHKGMTALCTYLMETSRSFEQKFGHVKLLPTYLPQSDGIRALHGKWVEKPVVGRLSNNIKIWDGPTLISDTGGHYSGENTVFQQYCAPRKVEGRNNFILGMWMCGKYSASLCAREFDTEVLSIQNERWIPHIVLED